MECYFRSLITYFYKLLEGFLRRATQAVSGLSNGSAMTNDYVYTNDRITSITHNGFTYNFEYDIWGNETAVKVGSQTLAAYTYTADESINTITYGNGDVLSYTYNADGNVVSIRWNNTAAYTYTYDVGGNIVQKQTYAYTTGTLGTVQDTVDYTYDSVWKDKLTSYDGDTSPCCEIPRVPSRWESVGLYFRLVLFLSGYASIIGNGRGRHRGRRSKGVPLFA